MTNSVNACAHCHTPLPTDGRYCSNCGMPSGEVGTHVCPPEPTEELRKRLATTLEGRYEIIRLLGRGGMAVVFLAKDLTLERQVAIKVLPPEMSHDPKLIPRFQQEAKTAARLDHPNIIPIYRVESEAGLVYFVMKYVTGHSLDQFLDKGPVSFDTARRILREAALALGHAHQRGIVHRDVKPANIMLEADGRVMLTDFGISKALDGGTALTGTGAIIGTPHYMAPEQAKGLEVDGRADQYSLGVVGHHLLTGKQPFDGSSHSILYKHVFEPPPRIFETRPDAPADLCAALDRALSKEPEKRFASMEDFAAAVSGERTGPRTVVSGPVKPLTKKAPVRAGAGKSRKVIWGSLVAVILCAVIGGASWAALRPAEPTVTPPSVAQPAHPSVASPAGLSHTQPSTGQSSAPGSAAAAQPDITPASRPRPVKKEYA
ncbi:MAG TPA: serine/threonine-protein kinase, partial [Gemmatimonadales bacterium]|nr:serine/threonine-protein kinase [Gemmatimonadales bacterium]